MNQIENGYIPLRILLRWQRLQQLQLLLRGYFLTRVSLNTTSVGQRLVENQPAIDEGGPYRSDYCESKERQQEREKMPSLITYKCQKCLTIIEWIYDQESEVYPPAVRGCPGKGCSELHELNVREISESEASERKSGELYSQ